MCFICDECGKRSEQGLVPKYSMSDPMALAYGRTPELVGWGRAFDRLSTDFPVELCPECMKEMSDEEIAEKYYHDKDVRIGREVFGQPATMTTEAGALTK